MDMKRAVVTHFDGDPFLLNFWLTLYEKYWADECDVVYLSLYKNDTTPAEVIDFNTELLKKYSKVRVFWLDHKTNPEQANQYLLEQVKEPYIGLIESDGFIYAPNSVATCFKLIEGEQDIVAPAWELIYEPYFNNELNFKGFMRCFFFIKKSLLNDIEVDFMPRTIPANTRLTENYQIGKAVDLDCFGYISWQLALKHPKVTMTPENVLTPDNLFKLYHNFNWLHVRQMSSSALGLGGNEFALWHSGDEKLILKNVHKIINEHLPDGPAEFIYAKAAAFRLLFWDVLKDKEKLGRFAVDYKEVLETAIDVYGLDRARIYEMKGYFRGLFKL